MRRYAVQDREDDYASRRDYQQITDDTGRRLSAGGPIKSIGLAAELNPGPTPALAGFGGFLLTGESSGVTVRIHVGEKTHERKFHSGPEWSRIGSAFIVEASTIVLVELVFDAEQAVVDCWGLTIGLCKFPKGTTSEAPALEYLNLSHLAPETLYLEHGPGLGATLMDIGADPSTGAIIKLKKCCYCGRQLPVGPGQPGRLSFHKHNDKISGHQNECRACKKWRINDSFNPLRTVDQLNESSVITRERRFLLREPEILQSIKEREGRGLKSIIWERFGRRCFYCEKPVELGEFELDHTRPLAYLWPIDEHATCLCAEHNNHKKDKFPVDFYTPAQRKRLSEITGLPLAALEARDVCAPELERIRKDIAAFAGKCDPRTFNAIARKVREIREDVDLWEELLEADVDLYATVRDAADERPESVPVDENVVEADELLDALEN